MKGLLGFKDYSGEIVAEVKASMDRFRNVRRWTPSQTSLSTMVEYKEDGKSWWNMSGGWVNFREYKEAVDELSYANTKLKRAAELVSSLKKRIELTDSELEIEKDLQK